MAESAPYERLAEDRADGAAAVEYQEPIFALKPVSIEGFANVVADASSSEWMEGRVWVWSGADAVIAACSQEAEGVAHGNSGVPGLGGFPLETTARRTRGNSAVWARATRVAA